MRRRRRSRRHDACPSRRRLDTDTSRVVLDASDIARALTRIAHEILERNKGPANVVLLGIPSRGVPWPRASRETMSEVEGIKVPHGALDITMYRDDLRLKPARALAHTAIPGDTVDDTVVVLVDDVLFSGPNGARGPRRARTTSGGRAPSSSPSWSTAAIASCPSEPTSSARTCPPTRPRRVHVLLQRVRRQGRRDDQLEAKEAEVTDA